MIKNFENIIKSDIRLIKDKNDCQSKVNHVNEYRKPENSNNKEPSLQSNSSYLYT